MIPDIEIWVDGGFRGGNSGWTYVVTHKGRIIFVEHGECAAKNSSHAEEIAAREALNSEWANGSRVWVDSYGVQNRLWKLSRIVGSKIYFAGVEKRKTSAPYKLADRLSSRRKFRLRQRKKERRKGMRRSTEKSSVHSNRKV